MKSQEKDLELLKYRSIVFATINYTMDRYCGQWVMDGVDHMKDHYEKERIQTQKYFDKRNLTGLKQKYKSFIRHIQSSTDLDFNDYIKEKTGYEVDIYKEIKERFETLIAVGKIKDKKDLDGYHIMFGYYEKTGNTEMYEKLKTFFVDNMDMVEESTNTYSKVISRIEKDGEVIETIALSNSPIRSNYERNEEEIISPDGKRKLQITQWINGKNASKYITILFPASSGCIYSVNGICPDVSAYWKDNSTIVVETNKNYEGYPGVKEVSSFGDKIKIDYELH